MTPRRPDHVLVDYQNHRVQVDGEEFPFVVAREPIVVEGDVDGVATIRLTLHVKNVEVRGR